MSLNRSSSSSSSTFINGSIPFNRVHCIQLENIKCIMGDALLVKCYLRNILRYFYAEIGIIAA